VGRFADPSRIATHELRAMLVREVRRGELLALPLPRTLDMARPTAAAAVRRLRRRVRREAEAEDHKYGVTKLTLPERFAPGVEGRHLRHR
jgi:hypothetical protein